MIDRSHALPIARQAKALDVSRGSVYYLPRPVSATALAVMHRMDELHLDFPFAGSRMLRDLLNADGVEIGRLHVATLMKRMGIEAIYRKPNTSKPAPGHRSTPICCARCRPSGQIRSGPWILRTSRWRAASSISRRGRLVQPPGSQPSGVDHHGSRLLHRGFGRSSRPPWQTRDLQHGSRLAVHQRGLHGCSSKSRRRYQHGRQGLMARQCLRRAALAICQYEEVYLRAYASVAEARALIASYLRFYNSRRPHSRPDRQTPDQAYFNRLSQIAAA